MGDSEEGKKLPSVWFSAKCQKWFYIIYIIVAILGSVVLFTLQIIIEAVFLKRWLELINDNILAQIIAAFFCFITANVFIIALFNFGNVMHSSG